MSDRTHGNDSVENKNKIKGQAKRHLEHQPSEEERKGHRKWSMKQQDCEESLGDDRQGQHEHSLKHLCSEEETTREKYTRNLKRQHSEESFMEGRTVEKHRHNLKRRHSEESSIEERKLVKCVKHCRISIPEKLNVNIGHVDDSPIVTVDTSILYSGFGNKESNDCDDDMKSDISHKSALSDSSALSQTVCVYPRILEQTSATIKTERCEKQSPQPTATVVKPARHR